MKLFLLATLIATLGHADLLVTTKDGAQTKITGDLQKLEVVVPVTPPPPPPPPAKVESADKTTIPTATQIIDKALSVWTLAGGVVKKDGANAGFTANVTLVLYFNHTVYQQNNAGSWWSWNGSTWVQATDPRVTPTPQPAGKFSVLNGQIIGPNGQPFQARGINLYESQMSSANTILSLFPGINIIRLNVFTYSNQPSYYQSFINQMTTKGIVVLLDDHQNGAGDAGGSQGVVFTGTQLQTEQTWFKQVATSFASNPYVWFGTNNEPSENPSAAALSTWQQTSYNTIRGTGNQNLILVEMNCGNQSPYCGQGYTASVYQTMKNIVWDLHYYGWISGNSTDQATVTNFWQNMVSDAQKFTSADGKVPIFIGEYGNSTDGTSIDANANQVITTVTTSGYGSAAWHFQSYAPADNLTDGTKLLSPFGTTVAAYIKAAQGPVVLSLKKPRKVKRK